MISSPSILSPVCKDPQQMAVIERFQLKAEEITKTIQEDYVAEAMIDTYFRNAMTELTELQKNEKMASKFTPAMFSDVEKNKAGLRGLEKTDAECVAMLNAVGCAAIRDKDTGLEAVTSFCFGDKYSYFSPEERGFFYYYPKLPIGILLSVASFGLIPVVAQIKAWTD